MIKGSALRSLSLLLPLTLLAPSCAGVKNLFGSSNSDDAGFVQVDELLSRVERVHVDCELAGQNVTASMTTLISMVGPEFKGDPALAFGEFLAAIELSEKQAKDLRKDFTPMQKSAERMFLQWQDDLEAFSSDSMREHSAKRMQDMRDRYEAVNTAVGPALEQYEAFNASLRDHALYLGNDFNSESVAVIEKELRTLIQSANQLKKSLDTCTEACQEYVRKAALRGQVSSRAKQQV